MRFERLFGLVAMTGAMAGCGPGALGVMPGVINDPHNYSLRRALLARGTTHVCDELRSRSMPLRFQDDAPIAGRFFPLACTSRELPDGDVHVEIGGNGYVWTPMSRRLGFGASMALDYDTDFLVDGSTMYVYLRPRTGPPPSFATRFVEEQQAAFFGALLSGGGPSIVDRYGSQIMQAQIARGITVVRDANGSTAIGVGIVPPGERPPEAYRDLGRDEPILVNERVEVRAGQLDFVGPLEVPDDKRLELTIAVEGAASIGAVLVPRGAGEAWLMAYTTRAVAPPPTAAPLFNEVVPAGPLVRRSLALLQGSYYLVLDNTRAPRTASARDDRAAVVSVAARLE